MSARAARLWHQAGELPDDLCLPEEDDDLLMDEPCRGCGSIYCGGECPAYAAYVAECWLAVDAAAAEDDRDDERDEDGAALDALIVRLFGGGLVAYSAWLLFRVVAS